MTDRYLNFTECINRLVSDYEKHGNLIVAFDFDNTIYDYFGVGDEFPKLEELLRFLKTNGFTLILFTSNEDDRLEFIINYCKARGFEPDYINESPVMKTRKPYYNILLDDRAGLSSAYHTLMCALQKSGFDIKEK